MAKSIELLFKRDGTVRIEAIGYKGPECEQATRSFEQALGQVTRRQRKPEHKVEARQTAKAGGR